MWRRMKTPLLVTCLSLAGMGLSWPAWAAFDFSGTRTVSAVTGDGVKTPIASIRFSPAQQPGVSTFKVDLQVEKFTDHFLSMREFKCLPGAKEISCYVPYPYKTPATASADNLAWLEHSLLFLYKTPAEFGAKLWNGVYFEFKEVGNVLVGTPMAVDLNEIASPPDDLSVPPYGKGQRHEIPEGARWIRQLVIE